MKIDNSTLVLVGGLVFVIAGTVTKQWFTQFINKKFDNIYISQERNEKERERDYYITLRGQQVTCDCLHELNYAVLNGTHNGELEKTNKELDDYRELLNKTIAEKAARHNVEIER